MSGPVLQPEQVQSFGQQATRALAQVQYWPVGQQLWIGSIVRLCRGFYGGLSGLVVGLLVPL